MINNIVKQLANSNSQLLTNELIEEIVKNNPSREECEKFIWPLMRQTSIGNIILNSKFRGDSAGIQKIYEYQLNPLEAETSLDFIDAFTSTRLHAAALKWRVDFLSRTLRDFEFKKVASIASGRARELKDLHPSTEIHCYDCDQFAVDAINTDFPFARAYNLNVLTKKIPEKDFDLIYSGGLFDYLNQKHARALLKRLWGNLKSGGTIIIGNAVKDYPDKDYMRVMLDWELIGRSHDDFCDLYEKLEGVTVVYSVLDDQCTTKYLTLKKK